MPLSEHEQRVLEQIEASLYAEDPKLRQTVKRSTRKSGGLNVAHLRIAILLGVLGLAVLVGGVWLQLVVVGVLGFVIMFAGGVMGIRAMQSGSGVSSKAKKSGKGKPRPAGGSSSGMAARAEDRMRRRFEEQ